MIYLDNAATTNYKPQCVIDAVTECLQKYSCNPGRNNHRLATELHQKIYQARRKLHLLYNNDSVSHVLFTSGCTQALNLAILGTARRGHVVISATEHNSVIRPVMQLQKRGYVEVSVVQPSVDGQIEPNAIANALRHDTYLVCVNHCSNVTGTAQQNLQQIGVLCQKREVLLLVDCAQSAGYLPLDMTKCRVNMVALPAHKGLHAMQGVGALVCNGVLPKPIVFGGTGTDSHNIYQPSDPPEGWESGTLPCPAILAMDAGISWWLANWEQHAQTVTEMQTLILQNLQKIEGVTTYSQPNKCGIVAFNVGQMDSSTVADYLAEQDIALRGGFQCAPLMHKYLGTQSQGVVRASVGCDTTKQHCYALLNAVEQLCKMQK